jgi:hypothetical protein
LPALAVAVRPGAHRQRRRTRHRGIAKLSALGLSVDINPAVVLWFGPLFALLITLSLKLEADALCLAREVALDEMTELKTRITTSWWTYVLFCIPTIVAGYMTLLFVLKLFPGGNCASWSWLRQFYDFAGWAKPSIYCLGDLTQGTPWVYIPLQTWVYVACVVVCAYLTYAMSADWKRSRSGKSPAHKDRVSDE